MYRSPVRCLMVGLTGAAATLPLFITGTASALPGQRFGSTVYVSPTGVPSGRDFSCASAAFTTVQSAVEAATDHGTVVVCPGTYNESVTIDKTLWLQGRPGAVIDAAGHTYGVGVAASYSKVTGLTVTDADTATPSTLSDGIVTAGLVDGSMVAADHVTISGDTTDNNVGSGIDLNSSSYSTAVGDNSSNNAVGINVSDDFGVPASHDTIIGNVSNGNPGGCGIALADHTGAGIFDNLVAGNVADDNGLGTAAATAASAGAGVILAGSSGGVYDTTVTLNSLSGNGHGGVAVHAHAPGLNFSGNVVTLNRIGTNNLRADEGDSETTGVYLGDAGPLSITVEGNVISDDTLGIFTAGLVTVNGGSHNAFVDVTTPTGSIPSF